MSVVTKVSEYSLSEEIGNAVSHGIGLLAALVGFPVLMIAAARHDATTIVGAAIFAAALIVLYLSSTLYHALPEAGVKRIFRSIDHSAIFLLIAGTYTPFTLTVLQGPWGWSLFGVVWGLALVGITLKLMGHLRRPLFSNLLYLFMGWLVVVAIVPLYERIPTTGLVLLVVGGLLYTLGVPFYVAKRMPWAHFVWHLFVLGGTTSHFFAVLIYAT